MFVLNEHCKRKERGIRGEKKTVPEAAKEEQ
jgi:hypothetical protein